MMRRPAAKPEHTLGLEKGPDEPGLYFQMAEPTRLELAASGVTGQRYNRLNYGSALWLWWWAVQGSNL